MSRYIATGMHDDGSEVTASVIDLSVFINTPPDGYILVECDCVYFEVKKGEIDWLKIEEEKT